MTWIQVAIAVPAAFLVWTLVRDFKAGLSEERLWGDPEPEETSAFSNRPEWETVSCKIYDFQPPRSNAGGLTQLPLDREA
ncbi:hypothetical protein BH23ACT12_BH23ACT12_04090 [soil metagenome]